MVGISANPEVKKQLQNPDFLNCTLRYNSVLVPYLIVTSSCDLEITFPQSLYSGRAGVTIK
jgi:hypothetical protein